MEAKGLQRVRTIFPLANFYMPEYARGTADKAAWLRRATSVPWLGSGNRTFAEALRTPAVPHGAVSTTAPDPTRPWP